MNRNYWLETDEPDYVVLVPKFEDEDIVILCIDDGDVPAGLEFDLVNTLSNEVMREVMDLCEAAGFQLIDPEHMAVTFRKD